MRDLVSSGHELKCPFVMERKKVDGVGIKMQAWKYPAKSCLVCEFWITLRARLFWGVGGVGAEVGVIGVFHR